MAQLITRETFEFFARNLLAGYVIIIVRSYFVVGARPKVTDLVIEAVVLSLINQFVFLALEPVLRTEWVTQYASARLPLITEVLVLPSAIGVLFGFTLARGWSSAILRRLSVPATSPVQRGYDFAFGQQRSPSFVIVTYEDGTVVRGYYGEQSLAATDAQRSDIFLERLYAEGQDGQWNEMEPTRSGLLSLKGVRSIEFLDNTKC